jgi:hypothetical protein
MMIAFRTAAALLTAGGLLRGTSVCAAPVLGNLTQPAQDRTVAISMNEWQASSFRLSAAAGAWRVRSLTVRMAQQTANGSFGFRIVSESALRPALGDVRAAFTTPAITGTGTQSVTFTVKEAPAPVLQPGQTYWLVAGVERQDGNFTPSTGLYYWSYALNSLTDFTPASGWSFGPHTASSGTVGANWAPEATTPFSFSLDAAPVNPAMTLARWRELHPGGPADNNTWLNSDHDDNSLPGLLDFAFNADRTALPVAYLDHAGRPALEFVRWISAPELAWHIQTSPDLSSWTNTTDYDVTITPAGPETERVRVALRQQTVNVFVRLKITKL